MSKMKALVTGATGYIGSNLVRRLAIEGWDVHVIVRQDSKLETIRQYLPIEKIHYHDGTSEQLDRIVSESRPEIVFHLASLFLSAHKTDDLGKLVESNILFGLQLIDSMAKNGVRNLVNTGTSWQYYESREYRPVNLYAATKHSFESLIEYYVDAFDINVITLLLSDTYGPDDPRGKLFSLLWKAATSREELIMSPGEQVIDIVYIDDVIDAYCLASNQFHFMNGGHEHYSITSCEPLMLKSLVEQFELYSGEKLPIVWGGRQYRSREVMKIQLCFDVVPGWTPRVSLENGIKLSKPKPKNV